MSLELAHNICVGWSSFHTNVRRSAYPSDLICVYFDLVLYGGLFKICQGSIWLSCSQHCDGPLQSPWTSCGPSPGTPSPLCHPQSCTPSINGFPENEWEAIVTINSLYTTVPHFKCYLDNYFLSKAWTLPFQKKDAFCYYLTRTPPYQKQIILQFYDKNART